MKLTSIMLLISLLSGAFSGAQAASGPVVLYPPDLTLSSQSVIQVYAFWKKGHTAIRVTVNRKSIDTMKGAGTQSGEVPLTPGLNRLDIGGKPIRVYYLAGSTGGQFALGRGTRKPPLVFRSYYLHPAMEEGCGSCHAEDGGTFKLKDQKTACYGCHDDFGKGGSPEIYLHEPVAAGECTSCHDPHFSARAKLQKTGKGCLACHDAPPKKGVMHPPLRTGPCTVCHSPHAGVTPKLLVRKGNSLCMACHENVHRVHRSARISGAMTRLPQELRRDGNDLSCLACHLPHQSPNDKLLKKHIPELCRDCHPEVR